MLRRLRLRDPIYLWPPGLPGRQAPSGAMVEKGVNITTKSVRIGSSEKTSGIWGAYFQEQD